MMRRFCLATLSICGLIASPAWADQPADWLKRMSMALDEASYSGVVIREKQSKTETYKVFHTVRDGVIRERLVRQEGDGVEIIRNGNEVHCVIPDKRAVLVETWSGQGTLFSEVPHDADGPAGGYTFELVGEERVAGRKAVVISVTPRDGMRFARRLWVDMETGFPLRSERLDSDGQLIDQIRFADIQLGVELDDTDFRSGYAIEDFRWYPANEPLVTEASSGWHSDQLPTGYRKESGHVEQLDSDESSMTHIVYTDGLSRVSVFIKSSNEDAATTRASLGSANSFTTQRDGYRITAVGEVPPAAVEQIALSMRR